MRRILFLLILLPGLLAAAQPSREKLEALRHRIHDLQSRLQADLDKRDSLEADLKKREKRIGELAARERKLRQDRQAAADKLHHLRQRQQQLAQDKSTQLQWLARTIRASYMTGREERLKLLLNQEHPDRIARLLRYQDYFQQARGKRLKSINSDLADLRQVTEQVKAARTELEHRQKQLDDQQADLKQAYADRKQALEHLNADLGEKKKRLAHMRANEQRLQKLLDDMAQSLPDIPANPGGAPFGKLSGRLPWPVPGSLKVDYHDRRDGGLRWNGVVLKANAGEPVRAIHGGRVVYADWLRGYGLLTIIDHGNGYLSLYGYNQSLLRDVGEWVATGDVIALAGNSGGRSSTGVYFEIRRRGKPVNPEHWCSRHVTLPPIAQK